MTLSAEAKSYIEHRGWVKEDYEEIGAFSEGDMVFFPLRDYNSAQVGEIGRSIKTKRYLIRLRKSTCGHFLWRGVDSNRVLFLVEGVFDLGWLLQNQFHAAAYLNNSLLAGQLRTIARFYDRVILLPDNDVEGIKGSARTFKSLRAMGVSYLKEYKLTVFKDLGSCFEQGGKNAAFLVESLKRLEKSWDEGEEPKKNTDHDLAGGD